MIAAIKKLKDLEGVHSHVLASRISEPTKDALQMDCLPASMLKLIKSLRTLPKEEGVQTVVKFMDEYSPSYCQGFVPIVLVAIERSRVLSVSLACNVVWCIVWSLGAALETIQQVHCVVITLFEEAKAGGMSVAGSSYNASVRLNSSVLPNMFPSGSAQETTWTRTRFPWISSKISSEPSWLTPPNAIGLALKLVSPEKIKEDRKAKFIGTGHYEDIELDAASTRNMKVDAASISESTNNANPSQLKLELSDNGAIDSSNVEEIESQRQQYMNQKRLGL
ncbi:hypothetical protein SUGI_0866900 [Cryptomeria japonica]|nr:hypothetical protein SUGI_0866900 [Cryptomeria japonica]